MRVLPSNVGKYRVPLAGKARHGYCVLVRWEDFESSPEDYIERAFENRTTSIASKTHVG